MGQLEVQTLVIEVKGINDSKIEEVVKKIEENKNKSLDDFMFNYGYRLDPKEQIEVRRKMLSPVKLEREKDRVVIKMPMMVLKGIKGRLIKSLTVRMIKSAMKKELGKERDVNVYWG